MFINFYMQIDTPTVLTQNHCPMQLGKETEPSVLVSRRLIRLYIKWSMYCKMHPASSLISAQLNAWSVPWSINKAYLLSNQFNLATPKCSRHDNSAAHFSSQALPRAKNEWGYYPWMNRLLRMLNIIVQLMFYHANNSQLIVCTADTNKLYCNNTSHAIDIAQY